MPGRRPIIAASFLAFPGTGSYRRICRALFGSASEKNRPSASRLISQTYTLCSTPKRRALAPNGLRINSHSGCHLLVISTLRTDWGRVFRGKFVAALKRAFQDGQLSFHGDLRPLAQPKTFDAWLRPLFRKDWVVYAKRPFGGPEYVLRYLGRYTHRVAVSNHRLVSFADQKVTFRWRDSAHKNEQRLMTLSLDEFLRRFLLHLLPDRFVRIRNFGFLANRRRATFLPLCFQLLGLAPHIEQDTPGTKDSSDLWLCPKCAGPMVVVERLTAAEIQLRSPPLVTAAA